MIPAGNELATKEEITTETQRRTRRRVSRSGIALAVAILALSIAPAVASGPAPDQATTDYEIDFMTDMVDHHHMAIEMSEVCLDKAVHEQLRNRCEDIIATQSAEIDQMESWLRDWYGVEHEPQMTAGEERAVDRLSSLEGKDFEVRFMRTMLRHHRTAIREANTCLDRAYHDELTDLCSSIIETQRAESELFERWLCDWYGRCRGDAREQRRDA